MVIYVKEKLIEKISNEFHPDKTNVEWCRIYNRLLRVEKDIGFNDNQNQN